MKVQLALMGLTLFALGVFWALMLLVQRIRPVEAQVPHQTCRDLTIANPRDSTVFQLDCKGRVRLDHWGDTILVRRLP